MKKQCVFGVRSELHPLSGTVARLGVVAFRR
jgi:hypothetical protein